MMRLAYNDRRAAALRPETGFLPLLAALVPLLESAAVWVVGQAASAGAFLLVMDALEPRDETEQQAAVDRAISATENLSSTALWMARSVTLEAGTASLTGTAAFEARAVLSRLRDFLGRRVSDIEREAAFTAARLRIAELSAPSTPGPGTAPQPLRAPSAAGGGLSTAGTFLLIGGGLLLVGGLWWGLR